MFAPQRLAPFVVTGVVMSVGCGTTATITSTPAADSDAGSSAEDPADATPSEDAGKGARDGGTEANGGSIELVAPQLSHDSNTGVYTASFRIKNGSKDSILELSTLEVAGSYAFPKIDRSICPPDTPGYQWTVPPSGMSAVLGVAFASSSTNLKTVIDLTCGSKQTLQSVPYGFDAKPPFNLKIELLLDSGKPVTLEAVLTP